MRVGIVNTGVANVASVRAAFGRLGVEVVGVRDGDEVAAAERLVLPGVGAYAAGRAALGELAEPLRARCADGRPTLAICLGMQLFGAGSAESPGVAGLGVFRGIAEPFPAGTQTPQLGWNRVEPEAECRLLQVGYAYFANSYRLAQVPDGWSAARANHGGPFIAALERGDALLCQFHPELSGAFGRDLLSRWLSGGASC